MCQALSWPYRLIKRSMHQLDLSTNRTIYNNRASHRRHSSKQQYPRALDVTYQLVTRTSLDLREALEVSRLLASAFANEGLCEEISEGGDASPRSLLYQARLFVALQQRLLVSAAFCVVLAYVDLGDGAELAGEQQPAWQLWLFTLENRSATVQCCCMHQTWFWTASFRCCHCGPGNRETRDANVAPPRSAAGAGGSDGQQHGGGSAAPAQAARQPSPSGL
jgi:hypothetical protein